MDSQQRLWLFLLSTHSELPAASSHIHARCWPSEQLSGIPASGLFSVRDGFEAIRPSCCLMALFPLGCFPINSFSAYLFVNVNTHQVVCCFSLLCFSSWKVVVFVLMLVYNSLHNNMAISMTFGLRLWGLESAYWSYLALPLVSRPYSTCALYTSSLKKITTPTTEICRLNEFVHTSACNEAWNIDSRQKENEYWSNNDFTPLPVIKPEWPTPHSHRK